MSGVSETRDRRARPRHRRQWTALRCRGRAHRGPPQVVRRPRGAQGHRPGRPRARGRLPHRLVGLGQVHAAALRQPAGAHRCRPRRGGGRGDHGARHERRPHPPAHRHRLPGLQPLPAHERPRQHHAGAAEGAQALEGPGRAGGTRAARSVRPGGEGRAVSRPTLRRAAAARRHRACPGHEARPAAPRRDHQRPRPGARGRGPGRHPRAGGAGHDDDHRHARDGLRAGHRGPRLLPRPGPAPRGGAARGHLRQPTAGPHAPVPRSRHLGWPHGRRRARAAAAAAAVSGGRASGAGRQLRRQGGVSRRRPRPVAPPGRPR